MISEHYNLHTSAVGLSFIFETVIVVVTISLICLDMAGKAVVLDTLDWQGAVGATEQGVPQAASAETKVCLEHDRRLTGHFGCHLSTRKTR